MGPLFLLLLLLLVAGCSQEQGSSSEGPWYDAMVSGTDHLDHGRYELAKPKLREAYRLAESDAERWETLDRLGSLYYDLDRFEEAEEAWGQALRIVERLYDANHPDVATATNNMAVLMLALDKLDEAETLFRRVIKNYEENFGREHEHTVSSILNLAVTVHRKGEIDEAGDLYEEALRIGEQVNGAESPVNELNYMHLGLLRKEQGRYEEAERLVRRAVSLRKKQFGATHEKVSVALMWLVEVLEEREDYPAADVASRELLSIHETTMSGDSADLAWKLNEYAFFLERIDRHGDAITPYSRALTILVQRQKAEREAEGIEILAYNYGDCLLTLGRNRGEVYSALVALGVSASVAEEATEEVFSESTVESGF